MIAASYIIHYGAEWLKWSIRSVVNHVDEVHLFYTPFPSHGHSTTMTCPESKKDIQLSVAEIFASYGNVFWHDCPDRFPHEGYHRTYAIEQCKLRGAEVVVVVDADELWPVDVLVDSLEIVKQGDKRSYRIGMCHFWRSLKWVCDDPAMPTRFIKPSISNMSEEYLSGKVFHMGYAQSPSIIRYKQEIHGHKAEWRKGWFENKFMANFKEDIHPTCENFWIARPVEQKTKDELFKLCGDHPYWDLEIIP